MAKNGLKERFMNIECVPSNHLNGPIMLWSEYSWKLPKCTSALQKKGISGNEELSHSLFIANGSWQLQSLSGVKSFMNEHSYLNAPCSQTIKWTMTECVLRVFSQYPKFFGFWGVKPSLADHVSKGQLILKCPFSVIVWTKKPTKFL